MNLETLKVIITADASGFNKTIKNVKSQLSGLNNAVDKATGGITNSLNGISKKVSFVAVTAGLASLSRSALKAASDLQEVQNVVDNAFGSFKQEADAFAKNAIYQFGISEYAAKNYSSTLMAMGRSMGIAADKSKTMSIQLTGLASDLASFYNTDVESAFNALQGIYTGQSRALRQYGVVISDVALKEYAARQGITKQVSAMNAAEKATLRYNYVLEATTLAQNDFIRTSASWHNSIQTLNNQFTNLATVIGTILMSALQPLVKMLVQVVSYAVKAAQALAAMFGISLEFSSQGGGIADAWDDATDATEGATGAAKKYKKLIDGFDELNIMTSTGGGSGASGLGSDGFDVGSYFDITANPMEGLDFNKWLQELDDWILEYEEKLESLGTIIGEKLNGLFNYVNWPLLGKTITDALNTLFASINNFFNTVDFVNIGNKFADMINSSLDNIEPSTWGQILVNKFNALWNIAYGFVSTLNWAKLGQVIQETISAALEKWDLTAMANTLSEALNGLTQMIIDWPSTFPIGDIVNKIYNAILSFIDNVDWKALGQALNKLITQLFESIKGIDYSKITKALAEFLEGIDIVGIFTSWIGMKANLIGEALSGLFSTKSGAVVGIVGGLSLIASTISNILMGPIGALNTQMLLAQNVLKGSNKVFAGILSPLAAFGKNLDGTSKFARIFGGDSKTLVGNLKDINFAMKDMGTFAYLKDLFSGIGKSIKSGLGNAMSFILHPIEAAKTAIKGLWGLLTANPLALVVAAIAALIASFIAAYNSSETLRNNVAAIWEQLKQFGTFLMELIVNIWQNYIQPLFVHISEIIKQLMDEVITPLWEFISSVVLAIIELLNAVLQPVIDALMIWLQGTFFQTIYAVIEAILTAIEWAVGVIGDLIDAVIGIFNGLTEFLTGIFTGDMGKVLDGLITMWTSAWDVIVGVVKGAINGIISIINWMIGQVQTAINSIIGAINSIHFSASIPDWVPIIGGRSFSLGFNLPTPKIPKVPMLADGGVLTSPTMAMLGEYAGARSNPEIATPQSLLRETIDASNGELASVFVQCTRQLVSAIDDKDFSVEIGDKIIGEATARYDKAYKKRTGKSLFAI